ncbi:hypothetical protein VTO42DRAFT_6450 [Malbranchea cinnamomea]
MRPCSLLCWLHTTRPFTLWRRPYVYGSRRWVAYEQRSYSIYSPGDTRNSGRQRGSTSSGGRPKRRSNAESNGRKDRLNGGRSQGRYNTSSQSKGGRHNVAFKRRRQSSTREARASRAANAGSNRFFNSTQPSRFLGSDKGNPEKQLLTTSRSNKARLSRAYLDYNRHPISLPLRKASNRSRHKTKNKPQQDFYKVVRKLAKKSRQSGVGREIIARDAELMSRTFYGASGEPWYWGYNMDRLHRYKSENIPLREKWEKLRKMSDWDTVAGWAEEITRGSEKLSAYFLAWQKVPVQERGVRWANIMPWLLLNSPNKALIFLRATNSAQHPPFSMVADCFIYLYQRHFNLFRNSPQFYRYLSYCLGPMRWPSIATKQNGLRLYLQTRKQSEVDRAFRRLLQQQTATSTTLLLFYVDRFILGGDVENALQALELTFSRERNRNRFFFRQMLKRCCNLLALDTITEENGLRFFAVLSRIIHMGLRLNKVLLNVVISNALKINDHELAWDIYYTMENLGLNPDSRTYLLLLDDAVERRDTDKIELVLSILKRRPELGQERHIISKTLHGILLLSQEARLASWSRSDTFREMLDIYCRAHDKQPLVDLGIITEENYPKGPRDFRTRPSIHSLSLIISAFVRYQTEPIVIRRLFHRFCELARAGHPYIAPLMHTDHVFNAFLRGMARFAHLLNDCVNVVETMYRLSPQQIEIQRGHHVWKFHPAAPTVQTWTILLSAFLWHKQPQTALTIRELMLKRGYKFNKVTWNVMISGFACMQKIEETAVSLKMMQRENFSPDEYTAKAVSQIRDWKKLREVLDLLDEEFFTGPLTTPISSDAEPPSTNQEHVEEEAAEEGQLPRAIAMQTS